MSNSFSKEEVVAFEELLESFEDMLVMSRLVKKYTTNSQLMERSNYTIWRPMPYISQSFDGFDQTGNFPAFTQLSVPSQISTVKSSNWSMTPLELNDALQEGRLFDAAKQKLSSDINRAIMDTATTFGSLVVARSTAATGFDDVAQCEAMMNEQGIPYNDRHLALSSRDYLNMGSNLAARETLSGLPLKAFEEAYLGKVSSFKTYKLDYANRLPAALGTTVTVNGANQYYTPVATNNTGGNVDNRFQNIAITVGGGTVAVGDCLTFDGVNAVHHITKQDTGQLKTFRITAIISGSGSTGTVQITPPIISGAGGTAAELQYKNVTATPANGSAITFLNVAAAAINPFWYKDSMEILPGKFTLPENSGMAVMKASTSQGFELQFCKQSDINQLNTKYRVDTFFGTVALQPEMMGIELFSQA